MELSIEQLFQNSFVITAEREKYKFFKKIFSASKLDIPKKVDGISLNRTGQDAYWNSELSRISWPLKEQLNRSASHQAVVRMAKAMDLPFVCIFEDNAYPCIDVKSKLERYIFEIPDDADCVVLGNIQLNSIVSGNEKYIRLGKDAENFWGSHAYIIFKKAYDAYICISQCADCIADNIFMHLDKVYSPRENLFIQYNNGVFDDCDPGYIWNSRSEEQIFNEFPRVETLLNAGKSIIAGSESLENQKIDYVFTYCNFDDEIWRNKYFDYLRSIGQEFDEEEQMRHIDRLNTVKYSLRSIDRYLPWINNVYMVVDGRSQVPDWVNTDTVKVVTHDQILLPEMLPCFNSVAIEHYISRVPNLTEKFLYGNDDFIALRPLTKEMFFTNDGKLNISVHKIDISTHNKFYTTILNNSWKFLYEKYGKDVPYELNYYAYEQKNLHAFRPNLKSVREEVIQKYEQDIRRTFTNIRGIDNITNLEIPYYYLNGYMTDNVALPNRFNSYASVDKSENYKKIKNYLLNEDFYTIVINYCSDRYLENVRMLLDQRFNFKSKYEK